MAKRVFFAANPATRRRAAAYILNEAEEGDKVTIEPKKRTDEQNALMWVLLGEIAKQVEWHGQKLTSEEWKDMATAALKNQRVLPGINGGFVVIGARTSKMSKAELSELVEFLYAFGSEKGVVFEDMQQMPS